MDLTWAEWRKFKLTELSLQNLTEKISIIPNELLYQWVCDGDPVLLAEVLNEDLDTKNSD